MLEAKLVATWDKTASLESQQKKDEESDKQRKKIESMEIALNEEKEKRQEAEKTTQELRRNYWQQKLRLRRQLHGHWLSFESLKNMRMSLPKAPRVLTDSDSKTARRP